MAPHDHSRDAEFADAARVIDMLAGGDAGGPPYYACVTRAPWIAAPPVCRLPGCADEAFYPRGFCFAHGLEYLAWRAYRDELEHNDLADTGFVPYTDLTFAAPELAHALDVVHRVLTREPFE